MQGTPSTARPGPARALIDGREHVASAVRRANRSGGWVVPVSDRFPTHVSATTLTADQWVIATLIAEGLTDREIAARLGLTNTEVVDHVDKALQQLGVDRRFQLGIWALRQRLHARPALPHAR